MQPHRAALCSSKPPSRPWQTSLSSAAQLLPAGPGDSALKNPLSGPGARAGQSGRPAPCSSINAQRPLMTGCQAACSYSSCYRRKARDFHHLPEDLLPRTESLPLRTPGVTPSLRVPRWGGYSGVTVTDCSQTLALRQSIFAASLPWTGNSESDLLMPGKSTAAVQA